MSIPPFLGARNQSKEQKAEVMDAFHGAKNCGNVDYVAGWYAKAADYMAAARDAGAAPPRCAFVSTNSICQGEQVANVWGPLQRSGMTIDFAHDTFRWSNEADDQAHVFCIIVGFSLGGSGVPKRLFHHEGPDAEAVELRPARINAYLADAPDVFVANRSRPLCNAPEMSCGNKPIDNGNYLFKTIEKEEFLAQEPAAAPYFHPWMGARELINKGERWVLWLGDLTATQIHTMPLCNERRNAVRRFRKASKSAPTQKLAATPTRFHIENMPKCTFVAVPVTSSERRTYIPMDFVEPETFCSVDIRLVPDATLYHFGVLCSRAHNAWMRRVCGRLESRYRYSAGVVYNNFPWPGAVTAARKHGLAEALSTPVEQLVAADVRQRIEACAQAVLDTRNLYPDATLAQLYDPENAECYPKLIEAHDALDKAVEAAYGPDFAITATQSSANRHSRKSGATPTASTPAANEDTLVAHLFAAYAELTAN